MVIEEFPGTKEAKAHVTFMFAAALQDYATLMSEIYELDKRDALEINLVIPDEPDEEPPKEPTIGSDLLNLEEAVADKLGLEQKSEVVETDTKP